ncbi:VanZ family protein [Paenibacillus sp. M1]|uniref:VanZ family protein n=1 Tax=Paenibacillus haidiansis TaxID=1574488 RepID=A0ABU7VXL9_9BACL
MNKFLKIMYWLIFVFYAALLVDTVFLARGELRSVNLVPFRMILDNINFDNGARTQLVGMNVWGNILMFIPAGIYAMVHSKSGSYFKGFVMILSFSVGIELIQYAFAIGATDIDDLILNGLGGAIGLAVFAAFRKIFKSREKVKNAIAVLSSIVGIPVFVLTLILVIVNY